MEPEVQYLEYVIKGFVANPDAVVIDRSVDNLGVLLMVTVHKDDMGKVLGKGGKLANEAIRPLMRVFGMKHNARVNVKFKEPAGGRRDLEVKTVDQVVDELS
jgi:predicted RNA-binding protein YlqC (UPF0109 family)